jgi:hypothetical protein
MKTLIKLLLVASVLIPLNTTHAFWGDIGDKYVKIQVNNISSNFETGDTSIAVSHRDIQLKDLRFEYSERKAAWVAYSKSSISRRALGIVSGRDDIKLVEKYVKKYQ